ncbi:MAG TPA: hypothetical protein PK904_17815 [Bacteroidales bacterium]|nr:hypothetical protein [Bacteroidales bacterium]
MVNEKDNGTNSEPDINVAFLSSNWQPTQNVLKWPGESSRIAERTAAASVSVKIKTSAW